MTLRQAQGERPNAVRGEAMLHTPDAAYMLRPTFAALCAAEEELGPLFALVERAAAGELKLAEMVALFWHCRADCESVIREDFADAVVAGGMAAVTPALKVLLGQILGGR